jgi:hypothetical protein
MANANPKCFHVYACGTSLIISLLACITLAACSSAQKTTTTTVQQTPGGTVTTTSTDKNTDTDTGNGASASIDAGRQVEPNPPVDANNTAVEMGDESNTDTSGSAAPDKVRVNLPGVKVNVDETNDKVDIKVPFVHIQKDNQGNTHIKAPFVRINSKDSDSQ